jgi:protein-L-isoaspartate(D-aspartate) O-methyltransferase
MPRSWILAPAFAFACSEAAPPTEAEFAARRNSMVTRQIENRGIRDPRLLAAMRQIPRHEFVPEEYRESAYEDRPLGIGHGQTISQPYIVAFMTEQVAPKHSDRILEVGTGSGYQAAILSKLVSEVFSIEIVPDLASRAAETLKRLGYINVRTKAGDGYQGWPEHAPFDAIIVTCAPDHVPDPLVNQLKEGGRLIIPVGDAGDQALYLLEKRNGKIERRSVLPVRFVPMTGKAQSVPR